MTDLLERAVAGLRALAPEQQDEVARFLLEWAAPDLPPIVLSPAEDASFEESLAESRRRDFASDEEVRAVWTKHDL